VSADEPWQQIGESYGSVASPTADKEGNVFFADPAAKRIYKADPDGLVYASQPAFKRIVACGVGGDEKVVAQNVLADDIALSAQATIYFTDAVHKTVGYIDAKHRMHVVYSGAEIALPSAVALSPDQASDRHRWASQI
jgi:hypothetical protein